MTTNQIIPAFPANVPSDTYSIDYGRMTGAVERAERKTSAAHLNRVGFFIQDNASDEGWAAAQELMGQAHDAHKRGAFDRAQTLMDQAHALAFPA
jgi:hypothetical protein